MNSLKPDYIPNDAAPLQGADHLIENKVVRNLVHGNNIFVTLFTGKVLVGRCEVQKDGRRFTIGNSEPIHISFIESAREV